MVLSRFAFKAQPPALRYVGILLKYILVLGKISPTFGNSQWLARELIFAAGGTAFVACNGHRFSALARHLCERILLETFFVTSYRVPLSFASRRTWLAKRSDG